VKKYTVQILSERCKGCGLCREVCSRQVPENSGCFNRHGYEYFRAAQTEDCVGCRRCLMVCPDFSIELTETGGA
jgi:Pyruvate/2-oxoacid:ferredoxin oxidoreductase delta subunit